MQALRAIKTAILKDSEGLPKGESIKGMEVDAIAGISNKSSDAMMEVDDAIAFVGLYEQMQCEADRAAAKAVLAKRIRLYRTLLEAQVFQIDESLALASLPATLDAGHRIQADLKAASARLTAIEGSLK